MSRADAVMVMKGIWMTELWYVMGSSLSDVWIISIAL